MGKITAATLEKILGQKSQSQDAVVKFIIGREGTMHGTKVGGAIGLTTWAAFTGNNKLAAVGPAEGLAKRLKSVLDAQEKAEQSWTVN